MANLFEQANMAKNAPRPLADKLRPKSLEQVVGQEHLLASDKPIGRMLETGRIASMILWGPAGVGKTTIARLIANHANMEFVQLSAVFSGVKDLRKVFNAAESLRETGVGTLLFIDEIHRFNKAQQDGFLPYVEQGIITLIGATTENPSFELNSALLSRAQVFVLNRLDDEALMKLLKRAEKHMCRKLPLNADGIKTLIAFAGGDGRYLLGLAEEIFAHGHKQELGAKAVAEILQKRAAIYDKKADGHYNLISALHKSIRGSDVDASLYWLARMLNAGEDPLYIARRLIRIASEDIGLAEPLALVLANNALNTYRVLGSPEGELAIAHAVVHMATAPKSNAVYTAFKQAIKSAADTGSLSPPAHILNAPTKLMSDIGYGKGYEYDHDTDKAFSGQDYFPDKMKRPKFYSPKGYGAEEEIRTRLQEWEKIRQKIKQEAKNNDRD